MKLRIFLAVVVTMALLGSGVMAASPSPSRLLPKKVKSYSELAKLLRKYQPRYSFAPNLGGGPVRAAMDAAVAGGALPAPTSTPAPAHSETNVQVAGVDEGDIVKTDGEYIYTISANTLYLVKAYPDSELDVAGTIIFGDNFWAHELYVDGARLVVIGTAWEKTGVPADPGLARPLMARLWWWAGHNYTQAVVYDISDPASPQVIREIRVDGDYLSSRKIGASVYLLARQYPGLYYLWGGAWPKGSKTPPAEQLVPRVSDTAVADTWRALLPGQIYYFPGFVEPDYVVIAGFSLDRPAAPADVKAYLGGGETVYASSTNLYLAAAVNDRVSIRPLPVILNGRAVRVPRTAQVESTRLYKFALLDGTVALTASGNVPGTVLNQFSMDENGAFFRIATTFHRWWSADGQDSNNLYVLDAALNIVGRLEGIAPGERIYSTRFLGDRGYMVTFRNIDPLFVIDLATPAKPAILGALKIPGYSNYLHPYDATHILGFGKDAVVVDAAAAGDEVWWNGMAFYQGMKVALFDVTDVANPVEMYAIHIGDRGTASELLWDHKALLFDRGLDLLAFPVTVCELQDPGPDTPPWAYGDPVFEGAYVYSLTLENGFEFKGGITHVDEGVDPLSAWDRTIRRLLYIDDVLYSVSASRIKANGLGDLEERATLDIVPEAVPWHAGE